ncbi:MAG: MFS transporter [Phycisphaerae bacterium]|nr:MFS transporter [Phycisphaerae bacterium]
MPEDLIALLVTFHMAGLLLPGLLIGLFNHKPKIRSLTIVLVVISVTLISVSLTPNSPALRWIGSYLFILQIFIANSCNAIFITLRSAIWRNNYQTTYRARIVILIYLAVQCGGGLAIFLFTAAMDRYKLPFQAIYAISGIAGLIGAFLYSKVKIHRERTQLKSQAASLKKIPMLAGLKVLRIDKRFRNYMSWQMLNGFATHLVEFGVLSLLVNDLFKCQWLVGGLVLSIIPLILSSISGIFWSKLFDKHSIYTIRIIGTLGWSLSRFILLIAVIYVNIPLLVISRIVTGLSMGVGQLAWRLGHMEFSTPENDSLYMGAHVTLTGLRGITAPLIGIYIYKYAGTGLYGQWFIGISAVAIAIAALGFLNMWRSEQKQKCPAIQ